MRKSLRAVTAAVILSVAFNLVVSVAQETQRKPRILGGYSKANTDDADVQAAAEFAVKAQGENQEATINLTSVERAEKQSAAGTNFRLCLNVVIEGENEEDNVSQQVKVVVHRNLKQEFSLTSWEEGECGE
jgi:hypothetical protein